MELDWANLDALPLSLILDKLQERIDHIWFGVVCKSWHSVANLIHQNQQFLTNVMPMLMIPTKIKSMAESSLYGIPSNKVYHVQLPVTSNGRCISSSHGWLAIVEEKDVITLLNPFKSVSPITLPPLNLGGRHVYFWQTEVYKVTLSVDPITSPNNYVVVAFYGLECHLAIIRAGQPFWTYISHDYNGFNDVVFYKGLIYAVSRWNDIVSFNDPSSNEKIIPNIVLKGIEGSFDEPYSDGACLVKSLEGDLLMVQSFVAWDNGERTQSFHVYKLDLDESGNLQQTLRLESLGDNVLFVGQSDSISVSASYFTSCLQRDSIYYTYDFDDDSQILNIRGALDIGIYNIKDESLSHHYVNNPSFKTVQPSFWILPPFKWD